MMRAAPAMRAPWSTDWPTPPQPMTATVDPGRTRAVLSAAPTPVVTPQPIRASCSGGRSVSTLTTEDSSTVIASAKVPRPVMQLAWLPSERRTLGVTLMPSEVSQRFDWSRRQNQHEPQAGTKLATTVSPTATRWTSRPTSSTSPVPSWPRTVGGGKAT